MIRGEDRSADPTLAEARPVDVVWSEDVCTLPLARRLAALVDKYELVGADGDLLP